MNDSTITSSTSLKVVDLSPSQTRFVSLLVAVLTLIVCVQFIRHHANPVRENHGHQGASDTVAPTYTGLFQLDPNTAPADSLELLNGIGPTLAQRIVAYRQDHRFEQIEDLEQVSGIGSGLVLRLRPYLVIGTE